MEALAFRIYYRRHHKLTAVVGRLSLSLIFVYTDTLLSQLLWNIMFQMYVTKRHDVCKFQKSIVIV
jgi:hypothetical protein